MGNRNQFKLIDDWNRYCNNERERNRIASKLNYDESKLMGKCYRCGINTPINFKTNKPYHACIECRNKENERAKIRRNATNMETI